MAYIQAITEDENEAMTTTEAPITTPLPVQQPGPQPYRVVRLPGRFERVLGPLTDKKLIVIGALIGAIGGPTAAFCVGPVPALEPVLAPIRGMILAAPPAVDSGAPILVPELPASSVLPPTFTEAPSATIAPTTTDPPTIQRRTAAQRPVVPKIRATTTPPARAPVVPVPATTPAPVPTVDTPEPPATTEKESPDGVPTQTTGQLPTEPAPARVPPDTMGGTPAGADGGDPGDGGRTSTPATTGPVGTTDPETSTDGTGSTGPSTSDPSSSVRDDGEGGSDN